MSEHDVDTRLHRDADKGYDTGYEGFCTCGWVGPLRDLHPMRRGQALGDAFAHRQEMKEAAA